MGTINPSNNSGIQPLNDIRQAPQSPPVSGLPPVAPPPAVLPATPRAAPPNLASSQTVEQSLAQAPPAHEMQQTSDSLKPLGLGLQDRLATSLSVKNTAPPPQLSSQQLHQSLKSQLGNAPSLRQFAASQQGLLQSLSGSAESSSGMQVLETQLSDRLAQLDKKAKHYNSPLYKLADKLGLKDRKVKLTALQQQQAQAQQVYQSLHQLQGTVQGTHQMQTQRFSQQMQHEIGQAFELGAQLVQQNKGNQGMLWSLGLQSQTQLKDTLAQSVVDNFCNSTALTGTFQDLQQDYQQAVDAFQELKAKGTVAENRRERFRKEANHLKTTDPAAAEALKARFDAEMDAFIKKEMWPLVDKLPPEEQQRVLANYGTTLSTRSCNDLDYFKQQPPSLYQVLSDEQKAYVDQLAAGVQSALPNRITGPDTLSLNGENYHQKTKIAQAGFAEIFTYTHVDTGAKIVVKQPIKAADMSEEAFQQVVLKESVNELQNHYHAMGAQGEGHPNLVKLIGAVSTEQGPLIAMEYIDGGDGNQFIEHKLASSTTLTDTDRQTIHKHMLYQMMAGVQHMQERGMTHMDIKFDNFFLQSDGTLKVADLGLSKTTDQFLATRADRGDLPIYLAPELMIDSHKANVMGVDYQVTSKADTWSVGVMAHKMLKGDFPFDDKFMTGIEKKLKVFGQDVSNRVIAEPQSLEDEMLNLMMHPDPSQRPTLESLMQSPIFDGLFNTNDSGQRTGFKQEVLDLTQREIKA